MQAHALESAGYIPGAAALSVVDKQVRKLKKRRLDAAQSKSETGTMGPLVYVLDREC